MELENDILLNTVKLQYFFIESLYHIKQKEYNEAMHKLDTAYTIFDDVIQKVHPLSEIRVMILDLRDKIECNIHNIKNHVVDDVVLHNKEIEYEEIQVPPLYTCFEPLYSKLNQFYYFLNIKEKID